MTTTHQPVQTTASQDSGNGRPENRSSSTNLQPMDRAEWYDQQKREARKLLHVRSGC